MKIMDAYVEVTPQLASNAGATLAASVTKLGSEQGKVFGDAFTKAAETNTNSIKAEVKGDSATAGRAYGSAFAAAAETSTKAVNAAIKSNAAEAAAQGRIYGAAFEREAEKNTKDIDVKLDKNRVEKAGEEAGSSLMQGVVGAISSGAGAVTSSFSSVFGSLSSVVNGIQSAITPLLLTAGAGAGVIFGQALAGGILAAPGLLAVGGVIAGTLGLALAGVSEALGSVFQNGAKAASAQNALNSANLAGQAAAEAVAAAERALANTRRDNAAQAIADAQAVKDAVQAAAQAQVDATAKVVQAQRDYADALRAVQSAQDSADDANQRSSQDVEQAEKDVAAAQKASLQAQEDLTQARKDAAQQAADLAKNLRDNTLDQQQAELDLTQAKEDLLAKQKAATAATQAAAADGSQANIDAANKANEALTQSQLDLQRAQNRVTDLGDAYTKLAQQQADAAKAGIDGSTGVQAALQKQQDAQNALKDAQDKYDQSLVNRYDTQLAGEAAVTLAQRKAADAEAAIDKAKVDGANSVAKANEAVAAAKAKQSADALDAQDKLASAEAAVAAAQRQTTAAINQSTAALTSQNDPIAQLSKNAQSFVNGIAGIKDALTGVKDKVQDAFFAPLKNVGQQLKDSGLLDTISKGLSGVATTLGTFVAAILKFAESKQFQTFFTQLTTAASQFLTAMGPGIQIFANAMLGLVQNLLPHLPQLGKVFGDVFTTFGLALDNMIKSGTFDKLVNGFAQFVQLFSASFADSLVAIFDQLADPRVTQAMVQLSESFVQFIQAVAPVLPLLAEFAAQLAYFVANIIPDMEGAWQDLCNTISDFYNNKIRPTWDTMALGAETLKSGLDIVWKAIKDAWGLVAATFKSTYDVTLGPLFIAFKSAADTLHTGLDTVWGLMKAAWSGLATAFNAVVDDTKNGFSAVWTGVKSVFNSLKTDLDTIWGTIKGAWQGLATDFNSIVTDETTGFGLLIKSMKTVFATVVSGVETAWNRLEDVAKVPIKFVVNTVINDGLIAGYNKLANIFNIDTIDKITLPKGFATGGAIYGPGTTTSDSIPARLSVGEHVLDAQDVARMGGQQGVYKMRAALDQGWRPGFATGGSIDNIIAVMQKSGLPYSINATNPAGYYGGSDHSGATHDNDGGYHSFSEAVDFGAGITGGAGDAKRNAIANFWSGYSGSLLELIHRSWDGTKDWAVKNGSKVAGSFYGESTMNAHRDHVHVAATAAAMNAIAQGGVAPGAQGGSDDSWYSGLFNIFSQARNVINTVPGGGALASLGKAGAGKLWTGATGKLKAAWDALKASIVGSIIPDSGDANAANEGALTSQAYAKGRLSAYGWGDDQMASLIRLWNGESNWNYLAKNSSSGAYGIPQALPGNKMASAGSDWATNPRTQINWGMDYIKTRYGTPEKALTFWLANSPHWYSQGGAVKPSLYDAGGDLMPGTTLVHNATGKVESTVTAEWTEKLMNTLDRLNSGSGGPAVQIDHVSVSSDVDVQMLANQLAFKVKPV